SVERRIGHGASARPESATADLLRVRFPRDRIGQVRNTAGMLRSRPSREAGDGEIRGAPEEVHGTALPDEAAAELLEHPVDLHEDAAEAVGVFGIVSAMNLIAIERNGIGDLARPREDSDRKSQF